MREGDTTGAVARRSCAGRRRGEGEDQKSAGEEESSRERVARMRERERVWGCLFQPGRVGSGLSDGLGLRGWADNLGQEMGQSPYSAGPN